MVCTLDLWVGDGSCDDHSRPYGDWFACPQFDWDGGDCEAGVWPYEPDPEDHHVGVDDGASEGDAIGDVCGPDMVFDCAMSCHETRWIGDGWCDDETSIYNINFDCEDFLFDGDDCMD